MDFIFNELCFRDSFRDIHSGKSSMDNLLQVCKKGRELGMGKLAVRNDFYEQFLLPEYCIRNWLNDVTVRKVLKDLLLSIVRQPYIDDNDAQIENRFISSYAFLANEDLSAVEGLAIAYLYQSVAVSLSSSNQWNVHEINLKFSEAGYDDQMVKVNHASQVAHIELQKEWIASRIGVRLPITELTVQQKEINLRDDHGRNILLSFSQKLIRSQYVTKIINSLPFNPNENDFVRRYHEDGKIELVLVRSDQGLGLVIQTTGTNLLETIAIAEIINGEFRDEY